MKVNPQITELHHTRLTLLTQILMEKGSYITAPKLIKESEKYIHCKKVTGT
jgi:hypothetical protein